MPPHQAATAPPVFRATSLEPRQIRAPRAFRVQCDWREAQTLKHPGRSTFHSEAEFLFAGLLEADPDVISYTPQPFRVHWGKHTYIPDFYVRRSRGIDVIELKPEAKMEAPKWRHFEAFFRSHDMAFRVMSNESVDRQRTLAQNWWLIVGMLYLGRDCPTDAQEFDLIERFLEDPGLGLRWDDWVDPSDRTSTFAHELALYRLLHKGRLVADLEDQPLNAGSVFTWRA